MKRILLTVVLTVVCTVLSAAPAADFVIRLLNGVTLENATIDSMSGSRFIVTGRLPDGSITTRTVSFADLTPESRDALMWQMRDRLMLASKPGWFFSGPAVAGNDLPPTSGSSSGIMVPADTPIVLPGSPGRISLTSITELTNGTLGWAASWDGGFVAQPQQFGRIYVYGVILLQGATWFGNVYPTCRTIWWKGNYFPCFATTPEFAKRINALTRESGAEMMQ
jgi:hypothetical protein